MVWETILSEFPDVGGKTVLAAIALPPSLLTTCNLSQLREIHLIHHADDRLCVWNPSNHDIKLLRQRGFKITHITGWRAYLGTAQHNYSHWTRVALPEGRPDMEQLEGTPGVLPFEVYSQAPLRLISWCSFELSRTARKLLRELAEMCELPETTTQALVTHIAAHNSEVKTEQEATQYLATLATVTISSRSKLLNYTTMVQHFLGTLQLPLAVYMLDYYLPMLSPNEGYNETGLTMQSAGPIRQPSQPIALEFLFKGSEFGHWKVKGGQDAFAFRHPSLGKTEVFSLLASDAHHHKVSPIGTGRLIAMVGTADALAYDGDDLQILFGLVLAITPRAAKKKDELAASRIYRQCNPKFIEVAFLSGPAIEFFAKEQLEALQDWYSASGQHLDPIDATVQGQNSPVPQTFFLDTMWMFGCTKPTRELTAVAQTPPCRYHLGLGIYNVQTAVEGMEGNKRSHFLHLCGQLLRLVLIPCHVEGELHPWTRSTALSFAAELDGHVLGTLCAVTMALLTNRLDLCIQGLFGAGKSKSMAILILALIEIDTTDSLKMLFICKENSGTRSFADLLLWLDPPSGVFGRIGRLVGDQERNKSSYSHTKFDIHPRERRQMLNKCQLILATGGTVAQDLTMQWSTMSGFMQELSLLVIDEGQQYGTDREIAVISLLKQQPLVLWTGDSEQTPGGIDRAARNAKRARQLPLAKKHGLRSDRNYYMPANLADAMIRLLDGSANEGLTALSQILKRGQSTLGQLWTSHLSPQDEEDLRAASTVLPGLKAVFEAAQPNMQRHSRFVDSELLAGTALNFPRSLVRLAWILQHAATLLPMAGDIQAVLNSQTAGVSDIHAWGLMLPSSSRVSPVTYHAVVAVRYPNLCRKINGLWELGSFASGGLPDKPPGFQLVLWDTNARINGLVATDLETLVSEVLSPFPHNAGFADGLFTMTTATDHKNNLNRSVLKRDYVRTLRVETIANSAGGTAQVSIVAQPSIGFLNTKYYSNGSPTEDTEDCLGRITVGLTRSKSLTLLVSPLDMMGLMCMAQVIAAIAYGIRGLRRGETTWSMPKFDPDPVQENLAQLSRWSLNSAPTWEYPPLAIANQYYDQQADEVKRARYRLILVRGSDLRWLNRERFQEVQAGLRTQHKWLPEQNLPFSEVVLYAYAADRTHSPTYVCLPSGLYKARTGHIVAQTGPDQEILSLPGIYFFDGWRLHPKLPIPDHLPRAKEAPVQGTALNAPAPDTEPKRSPEEEARDILAAAAKNQPEDGPSTRRAAVRACKYLRAMVSQYETTIQAVHSAARTHTQRSKGTVGPAVDYRPQGEALPVISADLTSELLHCLSTLPDPWPLAKITIDMEKPSQWVSKLCRLYFADEYAKRTVGLPSRRHVPDIAGALRAVQAILPKLEVKMIEFLAEWMVTLLMPASHVLEVRAPHLSFMMLKEYWFRELYLGLKVTASFDRSESYTRVIDGQVRCITPEVKPQNLQVIWNVQFITVFVPAWMIPPVYHSLRRESIKTTSSASSIGVQSVRPTWFEDTTPRDTTSQQPQDPQKEQPQPLHGLKLVIKEEVLPATDQPQFQSLELLAGRGLLAPDTWKCKRAQVSLKATIDVPMLGTIIEENGDGLLEDSHMPVGWPLHIDGAVRQCCIHRAASLQELDDMLKEYDMKRDSVEINRDAPQWSHHAVWNRKYMEPRPGYTLEQLWADSEPAISKKTTTSYDVQTNDVQRAVAAIQHFPSPVPPDSPFIRTLGTPAALKAPPQTDTLAQRALEEWERTVCENKAVAILAEIQAGRPTMSRLTLVMSLYLTRSIGGVPPPSSSCSCVPHHARVPSAFFSFSCVRVSCATWQHR